ncbi:MAG: hypothetical protein ACOC0O_00780 [Spirochaetota bacterium]
MKLKHIARLGVAGLVLVAALALFTNLFGRQLIPGLPLLRLQRVERFSTSSVTLDSVRELSEFVTVRYVHRAVFPYDYLPAEVSLNEILRKLRESDGPAADALTPEEHLYFRTWNLAEQINLSRSGGTYDFVVMTLVVSAGYTADAGVEEIVIEHVPSGEGNTMRRATVLLADPVVTDVIVEDIDAEEYPYPAVALGADAWRRVAEYVREQSLSEQTLRETLDAAEANGERFLRTMLLQAGFHEVRFRSPPRDQQGG